jgi:hypothetical protein
MYRHTSDFQFALLPGVMRLDFTVFAALLCVRTFCGLQELILDWRWRHTLTMLDVPA